MFEKIINGINGRRLKKRTRSVKKLRTQRRNLKQELKGAEREIRNLNRLICLMDDSWISSREPTANEASEENRRFLVSLKAEVFIAKFDYCPETGKSEWMDDGGNVIEVDAWQRLPSGWRAYDENEQV